MKWNKKTRAAVILVGALVFSGVGGLLMSAISKQDATFESVVVATKTILPYTKLSENYEVQEKIKSQIPEDAIRSIDELKSKDWYAGEVGFIEGQPIQKDHITDENNSKRGLGVTLEEGQNLAGITVDQRTSVGDNIKPGTLVDAFIYMKGAAVDARGTQGESTVIGPKENPKLGKLLVRERQTAEGLDPSSSDSVNKVPALAVVVTPDEDTAKLLVKAQEDGRVYLLPTSMEGEGLPSETSAETGSK